MNTSTLTDDERLASLKSAYFEALELFNDSYSESAFKRLQASEDAYMSFIETDDVRNSY